MSPSAILAGPRSSHLPSLRRLARFGDAHATSVVIVLTALLIAGDFLTGIEVTFTLLYAAPIALASWWRGRSLATLMAALCVAGASMAEVLLRPRLHLLHLCWNQGGAFGLFLLEIALVVRIRAYADKEAQERRSVVDQLRQAERLGIIGKLASGLAHELGTPLSVIVGHAELADSETATREMVHASSTVILNQAEKMTKIIRGLLDFSRRVGGERTLVDFAMLAREVVTLLHPIAVKRGVAITIGVDTEGGPIVRGNRAELEQVLVNIAMNGIQAMPDGGTLSFHVRRRAAETSVAIADTGTGIAPESLPKIFDPFFTTKDVGKGTGLGLSVSYGIVSDHGGRIDVTSKLGIGSQFTVVFPRAVD